MADVKVNPDMNFGQMADSYKKMADGTKDPVMKAMHGAAADHFKKMAKVQQDPEDAKDGGADDSTESEEEKEARMKKESEAKKMKAAEAKKKESEGKKQAEDEDESEDEGEAKKEANYRSKYINLRKETLMSEAGLSEEHKDFLNVMLEGKSDEDEISSIIKKYVKVQLKESGKRVSHAFPKTNYSRTENKMSASEALDAYIN